MSGNTILVRGVNWLGDAVMSTPALKRLREAQPDAHITLLTAAKLEGLWRDHPALDDVMTFNEGESVFSVGRKIRERGFETAVIFPNSPRSALECRLGKVPRRIGYARPWRNMMLTEPIAPRNEERTMEKRAVAEIRLLLETGIDITPEAIPVRAHHIFQYLELVATLGAKAEACPPSLHVHEEEVAAVSRKFGSDSTAEGGRKRPLIGINAGAEYGPAKRWPKERFIEVAVNFTKETPCDWWVFGGPNEVELSREIATAISNEIADTGTAASLAGETSLRELCCALKYVDALLTNDSGPMHVAAAVGTPVVALFGSTSPELTGPDVSPDSPHRILRKPPGCSPCFLRECPVDFRCMRDVEVAEVLIALRTMVEAA